MTKPHKSIGNLTKLKLDLTEPVKMTAELEPRALMLLLGANGSGKSLVLKLTYAIGTQMQYYVTAREHGLLLDPKINAQFLFDNVFTEQFFDGSVRATYDDGSFMEVTLEKGQVINIDMEVPEDVTSAPAVIFMSSNTRLFSSINKYLETKEMMGITGPLTEDNLKKLLKYNRIYDITLIESLVNNIKHHTTDAFLKDLNESMFKMDENFGEIQDIAVVDETDIRYVNKDGKLVSFASLGNGHQSLLTMMMVTTYQKH